MNQYKRPCEHLTCADVYCVDDVLMTELYYPREGFGEIMTIQIDLCDTRAADGIRVSYDFERDGYVIKQASIFSWESDDKERNEDWQEVAFIKAWARQVTKENE